MHWDHIIILLSILGSTTIFIFVLYLLYMNMATHVISCKYYVYSHTNLDMVILVITGCVFGNDT